MNVRTLCWFLAGTLIASITLNVRQATASAAAPTTVQCGLLDELGLSPEQELALEECCATCCSDSESLDQAIDATVARLEAHLADATCDVATIRELASELDALRSRRLHVALDSILEIRTLLRPTQVARLVANLRPSPDRRECGTK